MAPGPADGLKALVLAAGKSTRLSSIAAGLPKPLVDVGGAPVIARNLDWLAGSGLKDVWVNLHYAAETVRAALQSGVRFGLSIRYSYEPELLGTAGAWKHLSDEWGAVSLVVYGDNVIRFDLERFLAAHASAERLATIALFDPDRHANTGIAGGRVELGADGRIASFSEGGAAASGAGLVNAGVYALNAGVVRFVGDGFQDFARNVFPLLLAAGQLNGYLMEPEGYCLGIDTPDSYGRAQDMIRTGVVSLS